MSRYTRSDYLQSIYLDGETLDKAIKVLAEVKIHLENNDKCLKKGHPLYHSEPEIVIEESCGSLECFVRQTKYLEAMEETFPSHQRNVSKSKDI